MYILQTLRKSTNSRLWVVGSVTKTLIVDLFYMNDLKSFLRVLSIFLFTLLFLNLVSNDILSVSFRTVLYRAVPWGS